MIPYADYLLLAAGAFLGSTVAAVAGFGGAAILLPLLVAIFGVRDAIPILTVAQLAGNASRVWFNRREVVLPVVGWFAVGGVPAALIGGWLFSAAPSSWLTRLLGGFLLFSAAYRHFPGGGRLRPSLRGFALLGAVLSFLSALIGSVGPLTVPFFLAYGLAKGAFIGTEALATVVMHVTKLAAYGGTAVLTVQNVSAGLALAPVMILGSLVGKKLLDRLPERFFLLVVEGFLAVTGTLFLVRG